MTNYPPGVAPIESEAAELIDAAMCEGKEGQVPFSIGLLLDAAEKERASLDAIEQSLDSLRQSLDQRRKVIDQQEELLRDLVSSMGYREE